MTKTRLIAGAVSILCYLGAAYLLWDAMSWNVVAGAALVLTGSISALICNGK